MTKEEKIAQIADICGVHFPSEGRSKRDGTFVSGSAKIVKEQYNRNKALLEAVSLMVVGMNVADFLKVAVQKISAAQKDFSKGIIGCKIVPIGSIHRVYRVKPGQC